MDKKLENKVAELAKEIKDKSPSVSFVNEHGEKYTLYSNGITVLMEGDEITANVADAAKTGGLIDLFNSSFDIWSTEELYKLGEALMSLAVANGHGEEEAHNKE